MPNRKGFTLMEIVVVLVIIGVLSLIALPNYTTSMQQGSAKTTQNNLITIYGAEKNFYLTNGYYCSTSTQNTTCANTQANINTNLSLNISDNYFNYSCTDPNAASDSNKGTTFSCTATNIANDQFKLTVTNNPIILPGGSGTLNPSCIDALKPYYCPGVIN